MRYILMQVDKSPQSLAALTLLKDTSKCTFGLSLGGSRFRPVFFGSRSNQTFEVHYHSLVGKVTCVSDGKSLAALNTCGEEVLLELRLYRNLINI